MNVKSEWISVPVHRFGLLHYKLQDVLEGCISCRNLGNVLDGSTSQSTTEECNSIQLPQKKYNLTTKML